MKKIISYFVIILITANTNGQIPDPCTGFAATVPISSVSPCNCSDAQAGTSCNSSVFASQLAADNAIHTFLTTQNNYALPTTPVPWQDVRANNLELDGAVGGTPIIRHEFSTEFTTGPATNAVAVLNIHQVRIGCNAVCQDYKIIPKIGGTCGTNVITPILITSTLDPSIKYRQYTLSPNTTYVVSRQIYYDGNDIDCYFAWTGGDGVSSIGARITAQHWFIWSTGLITLPVQITSFTAQKITNGTVLNWKTAGESNNKGFDIEKSIDGTTFTKIGFVNGSNTSQDVQHYQYTDNTACTGRQLYRLKQIDNDNNFKYSSITAVNCSPVKNVTISPNPAASTITIVADDWAAAKLVNTNGQTVSTIRPAVSNTQQADVSKLPNGLYVLQLIYKDGSMTTEKIQVIH
jgi:hypothetical protein